MVRFLLGETRDGLRSRVPKRGLLVQLGATALTRAVTESSFELQEGVVSEFTISIDKNLNETLVNRATKEFRRTMTPMLLKEANLALNVYSIRSKPHGVEALCKLADGDARKVVVQQAGLNQLGVFIRDTPDRQGSQGSEPACGVAPRVHNSQGGSSKRLFPCWMGRFSSQSRLGDWVCAFTHHAIPRT